MFPWLLLRFKSFKKLLQNFVPWSSFSIKVLIFKATTKFLMFVALKSTNGKIGRTFLKKCLLCSFEGKILRKMKNWLKELRNLKYSQKKLYCQNCLRWTTFSSLFLCTVDFSESFSIIRESKTALFWYMKWN